MPKRILFEVNPWIEATSAVGGNRPRTGSEKQITVGIELLMRSEPDEPATIIADMILCTRDTEEEAEMACKDIESNFATSPLSTLRFWCQQWENHRA